MQLPTEVIDMITSYVGDNKKSNMPRDSDDEGEYGYVPRDGDDDSGWYKPPPEYGFRKRLATLRLVNKAFCKSASRRLFQHINATFQGEGDEIRIARLREISNSPYATCVRHIGIGVMVSYHGLAIETATYAEDLATSLSPSLVMFSNLKSLEFVGAGLTEHSRETKDIILSSVISALRYVNMPALEELDLNFPLMHDFGQLLASKLSTSHIPIENVVGRLRHLGLRVEEWTTSRHYKMEHRYWRRVLTPEDAAFPNEAFTGNIFNLIRLAENIQSLAICCTNSLNLDDASFPNPLRLRSLRLCGVSVSAETLIELITPGTSSLKSIHFSQVEFNSGTWSHVLLNMSKTPTLVELLINFCGYSPTGTSARLRPRPLTIPQDDLRELESSDPRDYAALAILQHRVNANRIAIGLPKISDSEFQAIKKQTLESAMALMGRGD